MLGENPTAAPEAGLSQCAFWKRSDWTLATGLWKKLLELKKRRTGPSMAEQPSGRLTCNFMVKPIWKGNLSPNTTPQDTVTMKHVGPDRNGVNLQRGAFWSGFCCPTLSKGEPINHLHCISSTTTHTYRQYVRWYWSIVKDFNFSERGWGYLVLREINVGGVDPWDEERVCFLSLLRVGKNAFHIACRTVHFPYQKKKNTYTVCLGFPRTVKLQALKCQREKRNCTWTEYMQKEWAEEEFSKPSNVFDMTLNVIQD